MSTTKKQPNSSTLRQRQAEQTASLIVDAARALFLEQGYATSTIEAIARRAGVAASTVYAVFGSKRGLLRAIRAPWHARSQIRDVVYGDPGTASGAERLRALAQATRRQWEYGADLTAIYNSAAAADPEAADELAQALEGRRKGMEAFAAGFAPHLRPGLSAPRAAAILQAVCVPEVYTQLVRRSGWTADEYEEWLFALLSAQLLA